MAQLRRLLAPVTAIWLCCQIGSVALVPVAMWITAADAHVDACTCGHGPHAICPMHHKPVGRSAPCAMQAANSSGAAILTTLALTDGVLADPPRSIQPPNRSAVPKAADARVAGERPVPPDPPPPRA